MAKSITRNRILRISLIVIVITFMFVEMNINYRNQHELVVETIVGFKNINHRLDKEILLVRAGLVRHYNTIDYGFNDLYSSHKQLSEYISNIKDAVIIEALMDDLMLEISNKEEAINTLKSDVGVLRNSLMYFSFLSTDISAEFATSVVSSKEIDSIIHTDLPLVNSEVIRMLRNPTTLSDDSFLNKIKAIRYKISLINNKKYNKNLDLLAKHLMVIYEHSLEVDDALQLIIDNRLTSVIDEVQNAYLYIETENKRMANVYQNIIYFLSLFLVVYSIKLIWNQAKTTNDLKDMAYHLGHQKRAMDVHALVVIADAAGEVKEVNDNYYKVFGVNPDDIVGKQYQLLKQKNDSAGLYAKIWNTVSSGDVWRGELSDKNSNDDVIWLDQTVVPFVDDNDHIYQYVSIATDITDRKNAERDIEFQAYHDVLTGLPNRRLLMNRLEQVLSLCQHHNHFGCLMFIDLDRFKTINDSLGHHVGDSLLKEVSERLQDCVTSENTVSRLGGDEFVVLIPEIDDEISQVIIKAQHFASEIQYALSQVYVIADNELYTTASIGISIFPRQEQTLSNILQQADLALYKAKDAGKKCFRFFDDSMQKNAEKRLIIENDLRNALLNDEFKIFLQPQYQQDGVIIGAEVLLRWEHSVNGMISPADFIPIAEETGSIIQIGDWVFETAFKKIKFWCDSAENNTGFHRIAINVSPLQFKQQGFVDRVIVLIENSGVNPSKIEFEITEGMLVDNVDETIDKINRLKALGISFSIDDFGTGYSSLSYLNKLPIEKVKIDQSFVRDIHLNENNQTIVQTIIFMSKNLGMDVIAEGVETKEELDVLSDMNCTSFQGYYFSRPLPVTEFEALVIK